MYRSGHRKFRLCHKKNSERRKYNSTSISLLVSIQKDMLRVPEPPISNISMLRSRIHDLNAIPEGTCYESTSVQVHGNNDSISFVCFVGWIDLFPNTESVMTLCKMSVSTEIATNVVCSICVHKDFKWSLFHSGQAICADLFPSLSSIPACANTG